MATDNGQKFGQLFKPRSIAFDDDSAINSNLSLNISVFAISLLDPIMSIFFINIF